MGNYTNMFNISASVGYSPWGMNTHGHGHVAPRYAANYYTVNPNAAVHPDQIPSALEIKYGILSNFNGAATHNGQYGHGYGHDHSHGHGYGHGHYDEYGPGHHGFIGFPGASNAYTNLPPQGGIYPPYSAGMPRQPMNGPPPGVNPGGGMDQEMPREISENRGRSQARPGDESHLPPSERSDFKSFAEIMASDTPPTPEAETPAAKVSTTPFRP